MSRESTPRRVGRSRRASAIRWRSPPRAIAVPLVAGALSPQSGLSSLTDHPAGVDSPIRESVSTSASLAIQADTIDPGADAGQSGVVAPARHDQTTRKAHLRFESEERATSALHMRRASPAAHPGRSDSDEDETAVVVASPIAADVEVRSEENGEVVGLPPDPPDGSDAPRRDASSATSLSGGNRGYSRGRQSFRSGSIDPWRPIPASPRGSRAWGHPGPHGGGACGPARHDGARGRCRPVDEGPY